MAKDSRIEWTHHTFNPWWGCVKISAACDNCYAEAWAKRLGSNVWGAKSDRRFFGDAHWKEPLKWNAEAEKEGGGTGTGFFVGEGCCCCCFLSCSLSTKVTT